MPLQNVRYGFWGPSMNQRPWTGSCGYPINWNTELFDRAWKMRKLGNTSFRVVTDDVGIVPLQKRDLTGLASLHVNVTGYTLPERIELIGKVINPLAGHYLVEYTCRVFERRECLANRVEDIDNCRGTRDVAQKARRPYVWSNRKQRIWNRSELDQGELME